MKKFIAMFGVLIFFAVFANPVFAKKLVYIIHSYHPGYAWVDDNNEGVEGVLQSKYELAYFFMDTKRLKPADFQRRADLAWKIYEAIKPDLVMIGDDNGLRLLGPKFAETETPTVYFGINLNPRSYFKKIPANITGALERVMVGRGTVFFSKIAPKAKNILQILDGSPSSQAIVSHAFQGKKTLKAGAMMMEYVHINDWNVFKDTIRNAHKKYGALALLNFFIVKDSDGKIIDYNQIVTWTSKNSQIPVFGYHVWSARDDGVVASFSLEGTGHGKTAAEIVIEILEKGKPPKFNMPRTDIDGQLYINKVQLKRYGLTVPDNVAKKAFFK